MCLLTLTACSELKKPETEPFYAQTAPPVKQEFRWSNGKMPKSFDPALASAAPETDVVRAVFEGLTDTEPRTLNVVPAIATEWTSAENDKVWTFKLRRDAKWSNGKPITAEDFVRSWKRLAAMREKISHPVLLKNIVGMPVDTENEKKQADETAAPDFFVNRLSDQNLVLPDVSANANSSVVSSDSQNSANANKKSAEIKKKDEKSNVKFGVEAVDSYTLKVALVNSDKDFPKLVAHPMFRPIFGNGNEFETGRLNAEVVTSGAFRIVSIGQDGITLDRAENFWNKIELERVKFVPTENAEKALEAYRAGTIDAVTNADFEPLAVKLLEPYEDFQRITHSALNFYEFNRKNAPFGDRRVREALAISIVRERLTEGAMQGISKPALAFSPFEETAVKLTQNVDKAKNLLAAAGFPEGRSFPVVRLVINRNNVQKKIADSVAKMWRDNLGIEAQIIQKEAKDLAEVRQSGEFDVLRRGIVLPTNDETVNMLAIFEPKTETKTDGEDAANKAQETDDTAEIFDRTQEMTAREELSSNIAEDRTAETEFVETEAEKTILTEETAIIELRAIPLYFPTSYSLVKPYVQGFELNTLDAPSLKNVRIDNNWQPKKTKSES